MDQEPGSTVKDGCSDIEDDLLDVDRLLGDDADDENWLVASEGTTGSPFIPDLDTDPSVLQSKKSLVNKLDSIARGLNEFVVLSHQFVAVCNAFQDVRSTLCPPYLLSVLERGRPTCLLECHPICDRTCPAHLYQQPKKVRYTRYY